ncbi:MAG TPA: hypothetical protein VF462_02060 [Micromonosporaceae bacterium]
MPFVQVIEYETDRPDEIRALGDEWSREQPAEGPPVRVIMSQDRDNPGHFMMVVEFDSYEQAMKNNDRPETGAYAERMRRLATTEPRYVNLDVTYQEA